MRQNGDSEYDRMVYRMREQLFGPGYATGRRDDAYDDRGEYVDDDEHEVVEVETLNQERGEVVGTIDTDGNLETESETVRNVSQQYLDEGIPVLVPTAYENEDGETIPADAEVMFKPGTTGFVRAFVDVLPSPFDCDPEALADLPLYDSECD